MGLPIGAGFVLHVAICAITAVIARLIERCREEVRVRFGVVLRDEIRFLGG